MIPGILGILAGRTWQTPQVRGSRLEHVNNTNSKVISLPTGTVAGDWCVVFCGHGWAVNALDGWTSDGNLTGTNFNGRFFHKYLTAADITAGSVTITFAGSYYGVVGIVSIVGSPPTRMQGANRSGAARPSVVLASVDGSPRKGDLAIVFGSLRGNVAPTVAGTTQLQTLTATEGCGVLVTKVHDADGDISLTVTYPNTQSGDYAALFVVCRY